MLVVEALVVEVLVVEVLVVEVPVAETSVCTDGAMGSFTFTGPSDGLGSLTITALSEPAPNPALM